MNNMDLKAAGGWAFPTDGTTHSGMTLRDYFAGQVIVWALKNRDVSQPWKHAAAMAAYEVADAMLDARKKQ